MKTLQLYDSARGSMLDGTLVIGKDAFKVSLMPSGFSFDAAHRTFADLGLPSLADSPIAFQVTGQSGGAAQVTSAPVSITCPTDGHTSWAVISKDGYGNGVSNPLLGAIYLGDVALTAGYKFYLAFPNQVFALG